MVVTGLNGVILRKLNAVKKELLEIWSRWPVCFLSMSATVEAARAASNPFGEWKAVDILVNNAGLVIGGQGT